MKYLNMDKAGIRGVTDDQLHSDRDRLMATPARNCIEREFNQKELDIINTEINRRPLVK